MEKLDNSIRTKEVHTEIYLKKPGAVIPDLESLSQDWNLYFDRFDTTIGPNIRTYLKHDNFYIEGAVCIWSYGQEVLTLKEWDLVDQLLAYFTQSLYDVVVASEKASSFFFPDQPLGVRIDNQGSRLLLTVGDARTFSISTIAFCQSLVGEARTFFEALNQMIDARPYSNEIVQMTELLDAVGA